MIRVSCSLNGLRSCKYKSVKSYLFGDKKATFVMQCNTSEFKRYCYEDRNAKYPN